MEPVRMARELTRPGTVTLLLLVAAFLEGVAAFWLLPGDLLRSSGALVVPALPSAGVAFVIARSYMRRSDQAVLVAAGVALLVDAGLLLTYIANIAIAARDCGPEATNCLF
jgi:hypothetical protein